MSNLFTTTALTIAFGLTATMATAQTAPATTDAPAAATTAAPAAASVAKGATVYDAQGGTVGTVDAVDAKLATVSTATTGTKVQIPLGNFGTGEKGPVIGMTAAQLDSAAGVKPGATPSATASAADTATPAAATTAEPPKLAKGASVVDTSGAAVGTFEDVTAEFATVATAKNKVRLPLNAFAAGTDGPVIGMTAAQLDEAAEAAKPKG